MNYATKYNSSNLQKTRLTTYKGFSPDIFINTDKKENIPKVFRGEKEAKSLTCC